MQINYLRNLNFIFDNLPFLFIHFAFVSLSLAERKQSLYIGRINIYD